MVQKIKEVVNPTSAGFLSASDNGTIPLLIKGAMKEWPALKLWNAKDSIPVQTF
jgi:hypothetical protein